MDAALVGLAFIPTEDGFQPEIPAGFLQLGLEDFQDQILGNAESAAQAMGVSSERATMALLVEACYAEQTIDRHLRAMANAILLLRSEVPTETYGYEQAEEEILGMIRDHAQRLGNLVEIYRHLPAEHKELAMREIRTWATAELDVEDGLLSVGEQTDAAIIAAIKIGLSPLQQYL